MVGKNRKDYGPLDAAVMDVVDDLQGDMSGSELARRSGIGHNRMAVILRRDTPPPTVGEVELIGMVFNKPASEIVAEAEAALGIRDNWPQRTAEAERLADRVAEPATPPAQRVN